MLCKADVFHLTKQADVAAPASIQASLYVDDSSGKAVLFAFQGGDRAMEATLKLRGLQPARSFRLLLPHDFGPPRNKSGKELIDEGLVVKFPRPGSSAVIQIEPD